VYDNNYTAQTGGVITSDAGSTITVRGVCWDNSPNPTVNNDTTINGDGTGNFSSNIENIASNTTYYVRAYATNSNGTGYGNELSFTSAGFTLIPDQNFEQFLIGLGHDDVIDGHVLTANISSIETLTLPWPNEGFNLTGIEDFAALKTLSCIYFTVNSLNLSQNTALTLLDFEGSTFTCLNLKNGNNVNMSVNLTNTNPICIEVDDPNWATQNWSNGPGQYFPFGTTFSTNCNYPAGCF
jgi:hypothetical protein